MALPPSPSPPFKSPLPSLSAFTVRCLGSESSFPFRREKRKHDHFPKQRLVIDRLEDCRLASKENE